MTSPIDTPSSRINKCHEVAALNQECACLSVDRQALSAALEAGGLDFEALEISHPHLFSSSAVFISQLCLERMAALAAAVEAVSALPAYQERVLTWAPPIARRPVPTSGVFLGYDFHLSPAGPRLIEINTNAGGALLNTRLSSAQRICCGPAAALVCGAPEAEFVAMFREEWRRMRGEAPLRRIVLVDEAPETQYLAPEFALFQQLLEASGIAALIADPRELAWDGRILTARGQPVDLVYNRLTDFALVLPAHAALAAAYEADGAVITPHPRAHALFADKRNLTLLSNADTLAEWGVPEALRAVLLESIPRTVAVTPEAAEAFWAGRKTWFFKPAAGFGSRAAYRGDKLTRRVFEDILGGGYVAQALVPPSERRIPLQDGGYASLKLDVRNYVYGARVQLVAARLYQGQTTNFRTPGGGFASILAVPCEMA